MGTLDTVEQTTTSTPAPIAVFGLDGSGKPHASYFAGGEAELATNAAAIMGMHVLPLDGPECDGLAEQMPQGRIFEKSRRAFVPFAEKRSGNASPPSAAFRSSRQPRRRRSRQKPRPRRRRVSL